MSKEMTVIALGVLVVVTPFLGIPGSWKTIIFIIAGAGLAAVGFLLRGESLARGGGESEHRPYVENQAPTPIPPQPNPRDNGIGSLN